MRGGGGEGEGGSLEKFSMQFTDSKSQQQSPLVAFLATTVLVINTVIIPEQLVNSFFLI